MKFSPETENYSRLLAESYQRWTERALYDGADIFDAPFPIVSHGTEADPIFRYANRSALALWEMDWQQFTRLPSRESAEPIFYIQGEREQQLTKALQNGWVDDYEGIRISATEKRFMITDTVLWNVTDAHGMLHGQAARIGRWKYL